MTKHSATRRTALAAAVVGSLAFAACGSGSNTTSSPSTPTPSVSTPVAPSAGAEGPVLPVTSNPIDNPATDQLLAIDSVLVENNEDANGNTVDDHLEIALTNTGTTELGGFGAYYTFDDPTASVSESYYLALPASFTIAPGSSRVIHFDNTGAPDHFAVNDFSLYATSANALDVTVEVSAADAAVQTASVQKDAGGAETAD